MLLFLFRYACLFETTPGSLSNFYFSANVSKLIQIGSIFPEKRNDRMRTEHETATDLLGKSHACRVGFLTIQRHVHRLQNTTYQVSTHQDVRAHLDAI